MSHSYVSHDSLLRLPWLIPMCDVNHLYVYHDPHLCVPWLINHQCRSRDMFSFKKIKEHLYAGTHICVCAPSFNDSHLCVQWLTFLSMTYFLCVSWLTFISWMRHGPEFYRRDFPTKKKLEHLKEEKEQFICPCIYAHTHSHTHTHTHTHKHTHMYTHSAYCKSNQNWTRVKRVKSLRSLVSQEISILLRPRNNSSKHCSKE